MSENKGTMVALGSRCFVVVVESLSCVQLF